LLFEFPAESAFIIKLSIVTGVIIELLIWNDEGVAKVGDVIIVVVTHACIPNRI
jgi:hypothetical protein